MAAWRYEISLLVLKKYFTRSLRSLVKYFSTLEEKFRISARPCNILYVSFTIPNITRESILLPVVSVREERIFYTITFTECQKKKNGCQKFTNWYSLTDCKKKTLISTCRSVLVNVFLNNIPNC